VTGQPDDLASRRVDGHPGSGGGEQAEPAEPVTPAGWVPDRGEVIWLEFDPQAGREQAGRRPAVVLSPASYNAPTGRALCVPVSTRAKGYPFEVPLPDAFPVRGVAFADQVKCLDWRARFARPVAALPPQLVATLLARTRTLLE
jgi:mRNA interferase MazF